MLKKGYIIKPHFYDKFQERAKNHFPKMRHKNIFHKVANIMRNVDNLEDLFCHKRTYFLPVKLSRNGEKQFYIIIKDDKKYLALVSIYTEDMFLKRYGNKIKH